MVDAEHIDNRRSMVNQRYVGAKQAATERRDRLNKAITVHQFLRDVDEEESWIKEKKLLVSSDDYGRDLIGIIIINGKLKER